MSWAFRQARKITGGAADVVQKATGAAFDVIADTAKKVGKTVEQIAKDPKMLAAIAISVAYPGAGAALGKALGLGSTTGAIIGNTMINTALNGGDLKKGLQSAIGSYAGVVVGGMASEIVKGGAAGSFLQSQAGLVDKAVNNAVSAAIKGKDPSAAIAGTIMNAAVAQSTSTIPGFANLPQAARTAISGSITQALQGKDLDVKSIFADAATSAVVGYGLSKIEGYDALDDKYKKLAATTLAASLKGKSLTENVINWALDEANKSLQQTIRDDKEAKAKEEGWKNYPEKLMAQMRGYSTAQEYYDSLKPKTETVKEVEQPEYEDEESSEEESEEESEEAEDSDESVLDTDVETDSSDEDTSYESVDDDTEQRFEESETIRNLNPSDEEVPSAPSIEPSEQEPISEPPPELPPAPDPDEVARSQGWESDEEKTLAESMSYFDPSVYHADVAAQSAGWEDEPDRLAAEALGITDVESWKTVKQEDLAKSEGWENLEQKNIAQDLGFDTIDSYNQHLADEEAKDLGFENAQDRTDALSAGQSTIEGWTQYKIDESARALGFDDAEDQQKADDAGFKDSQEWNDHLNEERIIEFFNDNVGRDPTPEELQDFQNMFAPAKDADEFTDEQVENLIYGSIDTSSYVYGPDGERYDSEADAVASGVFDFTDEWEGPVYGSDGNEYESAADAIANGIFDFDGIRPEDFVEDAVEEDEGTQGEVVWDGQVITDDGTIYDSAADALADGQFHFEEYIPDETDVTDEEEKPIVWEEDEEEEDPYEGPVWGPDGTEYESAEAAMAEGVFDFTESPPEEEVPEDTDTEDETAGPDEPIVWEEDEEEDVGPDEPIVWEEDEEEPGSDKPIVWEEDEEEYIGPEEPIVWEEDEEEYIGPEEPIVWEEDEEEPGPEEPIVWEEDEEEPEKPIVWEEDEEEPIVWEEDEEETTCEPGFHDDGTGLCVADDDEQDTEEPDTGGGTSYWRFPNTTRAQILQRLAKSAVASPAFQNQISAPTNQAASPIEQAATTPEVIQQKSPLEQLGGKSIYPKRFRSVLQDYLDAIEPPEEFYAPAEGLEAPAPAEALEQQSTIEQYREPDMATSTYFNYGQPQDISEFVQMQKEQDLPLGEGLGLSTAFAAGGMAAPLLMAKGGTGHGKNAHGALSIVQHSGKHRIDYRQGDAVTGAGDGQSDDIPAMLADGEFVFPADVVAALGNGSTKAGSDKLYEMMHSIRAHHRAAKPKDLPPPAKKSPLDYLKKGK